MTDERTARVAWARLAEPGDPHAHQLVTELGAVDALAAACTPGSPQFTRFAARSGELDPERDLEITERCRARTVVPGDPEWPPGLDELEQPPFCLFVKGPGHLAEVTAKSVAVVGSRAATAYGEHVAGELAAGLVRHGFTIVSGAAFGIDGAAHRGALAADGCTLAVLAGGVDRPYPAAHARLIQQVAQTGAVLSEVPPASAPTRVRFLLRNRVIAAMTGGTLVVEAGLRSGARSTVEHAVGLGRPVAAVPGPVTSMVSAGCHVMIRDGVAVLVTDADEAAEQLGRIGEHLAPVKRGPVLPQDDLAEPARRVAAVLPPYRSVSVDDLCRLAGMPAEEVMTALGQLELADMVEHRLDGWGKARRR